MKFAGMVPFRAAMCCLLLLFAFALAQDDLTNKYCSSENTASDDGPYYSIYMSMGECSGKCGGFAFAVLQGKNCWCSDYIPSDQASTSDCNSKCPGYPSDLCGNPDDGLYGYVALGKPPLGTAGGSGNKNSPPWASAVSPTVTRTVTQEQTPSPSVVVSYVTPAPTWSDRPWSDHGWPSSSSPPPSSSTSSSSQKQQTTTDVQTKVTTISGNAVTQTVTTTPIGVAPNNAEDSPELEKEGLSGGAIAGIAIGTLLGIAVLALAAFLLWRRRSSSDTEGGSNGSPKRKGSVLSRAGLLGGAVRPQSMSENNYDDPPYSADPMTRANSVRHSMMFGTGTTSEGVAPVGPLGGGSDSGSENRHSKPMVYDQRLNPSALFVHHDNGSRTSMQDQQDYSRPLGVANPDFARTYSFDSR